MTKPTTTTITAYTAFEMLMGYEPQADTVMLHRLLLDDKLPPLVLPPKQYWIEELKDGTHYVRLVDRHFDRLASAVYELVDYHRFHYQTPA